MDGALTILASHSLLAGSLLALLLKGTVVCVTGVAITAELSMMPAVVRHRIGQGTILCLAILPLLSWTIAPWELAVLPRGTNTDSSGLWQLAGWITHLYLAIALLLLARLCADLISTAALGCRAVVLGTASDLLPQLVHSKGDAVVKISDEVRTPVTWGWLHPQVVLPCGASEWPEDELVMVLQHELTHIERADWAGHLLARCVQALYWPIPGIRKLMNQLSLSAEQACDDRVLATGTLAHDYAAMLVRQARGTRIAATMSLGQDSELGIRVRYLVAEIVDHSTFARGGASTLLACIAVTLPLATVELASRPVIPNPTWGGVNQDTQLSAPTTAPHSMQFDEAAMEALRPGPERPTRPPSAKMPPQHNWQDKPTIPPP